MMQDAEPDYVTRCRETADIGRSITGNVVLLALVLGGMTLMATPGSQLAQSFAGGKTGSSPTNCLAMLDQGATDSLTLNECLPGGVVFVLDILPGEFAHLLREAALQIHERKRADAMLPCHALIVSSETRSGVDDAGSIFRRHEITTDHLE